MKYGILLIAFISSLLAQSAGELSFYILKEGKALAQQNVLIYNQESKQKIGEFVSDSDGYLHALLPAGAYQLQVVAKDGKSAQAFVRKNFIIEANRESQIILSLKNDNSLAFTDVEAPKVATTAQAEVKKVENGTLQLLLSSSEAQKPIAKARAFVKGMDIEKESDANGNIMLTLPAGEHTLSIIHGDFSAQTIKVIVAANESTMKSVELSPASMELEEFVVLAPNVEGSIASVMAEEKNSDSIASVIGSEQMSKQGDSNAASALKRVAGITLMGGKYIYVRGLGDRYSSTELNSMSLPSPNPIKRTVPLDMFPSGVIGSLQVQKSFSPDITGAFGGGYVNIRTKQTKDDDYVKLKVGVSAHSSIGKEATSYEGSGSDWSGYDNSFRPFNAAFNTTMTPILGQRQPSLSLTNNEIQDFTTARSLNTKKTAVPMGKEISLEASQNFTLSDGHEIGVLASYGYKNDAELREYTSYDYLISSSGVMTPTPDNMVSNSVFKDNIQHGGMLNISYGYENFDAKYTKLYVINTLNQTRDAEGTFGENNSIEHQNYLEWQERELNIDQLSGGFDYTLLDTRNRFDFGAESATASEYVPNDVYYDYRKTSLSAPYTFLARQSQVSFTNRSTDDTLLNAYIKNRSTIPMLSDEDYIELGAVVEQKEREGRINRLRVQSAITDQNVITAPIDAILNYVDASKLSYDLTSRPKDQYDASLERNAIYVKSMIKPSEELELTLGVRQVNLTQSVDQWALVNNLVATQTNSLEFAKTLPSLGVKYAFDEQNQFKFSYSQTFVYPDFREFVNSEFTHPEFLATIAGNPNLSETDIHNIDFQYGFYFDDIDNITASLFYKDMQNPIEDVQTFTTSTLDRYSFENSAAAELAGLELSWYKNLGFLDEALESLVFSGNYTYIYSKVTLTDAQKAKFVTQDRGLQGLSPEVINLSLTYQEDARSLNLSYNKMSERLMRVALKNGTVVYALDDYEVPPHLLDFTWIEKFRSQMINSDLEMTFKIKNILDGETTWKQGSLTTLKYKTGQSASLSLGAKF